MRRQFTHLDDKPSNAVCSSFETQDEVPGGLGGKFKVSQVNEVFKNEAWILNTGDVGAPALLLKPSGCIGRPFDSVVKGPGPEFELWLYFFTCYLTQQVILILELSFSSSVE